MGTLAILVCGLRDDSRVKMKLFDMKAPIDVILQASMVDSLNMLTWLNSTDAIKNINRPQSLVANFLGAENKDNEIMTFSTVEEFEKKLKEIKEGSGVNA